MILVSIISLAAVVWLFNFFDKKTLKYIMLSYTLMLCLFFVLLFYPIYHGHSFINLVYSFFDVPSYLCVILSIFFMTKVVIGDFSKTHTLNEIQIKSSSVVLIFIAGTIYFTSALGVLGFNVYYFNVLNQAIIMLIICLFIFFTDKMLFFMIVLSLVPFAFFNNFNLNIFEFIICPYLWMYCAVKSIHLAIVLMIKNYKRIFSSNKMIAVN